MAKAESGDRPPSPEVAAACDADEALGPRLRQESQRRHVKVTEVAAEVVAAYGSEDQKTSGLGE